MAFLLTPAHIFWARFPWSSLHSGNRRAAKCTLRAPSTPHFYCSACLIDFPPSLGLVEFIGIGLVIKRLVNKYKTFHQFTQMFYCPTSCSEVTHGAHEKNVISILFYPPGLNCYLPQASIPWRGLKCLPSLFVKWGENIADSQWLPGPQRNFREKSHLFS